MMYRAVGPPAGIVTQILGAAFGGARHFPFLNKGRWDRTPGGESRSGRRLAWWDCADHI